MNQKEKDYERLGRMIEAIYETGHADRRAIFKFSFLKGMVGGFGGVIGATLIVAVLLWLLSLADQIPFVGRIFESLKNAIDSR